MENHGEEELIRQKKQKIENFFKNQNNWGIISVLILAFVTRLYYFFITKDQAHWWDSLAYGSLAKQSILGLWTDSPFLIHESIIRAPLLPLVWSWLIRFNFSEALIIFVVEFIPSILSVFFVYLIGKELYNKKVGLISSYIMAISWLVIFYSARIMTDIPALLFSLMSIYFFVLYCKQPSTKKFSLSIFFLSLAVLMRNVSVLIGGCYVLFLILTTKFEFLKKKSFWKGGLIGVIPLGIFFVSNFVKFGNFLPSLSVYSASVGEKPGNAYYVITNFFPHIFQNYLLLFLVLGISIFLLEIILGYDMFKKSKKLRSHAIMLLIVFSFLIFFIFVLKAAEDRYLLVPLALFSIIIANSLLFLESHVQKYNKHLGTLFMVFLLIIFAYSQFSYGHDIIDSRSHSYLQMKQAFTWINENTPRNSKFIGDGIDPYLIYYAERQIQPWSYDTFEQDVSNSDYVILHGFEHQSAETVEKVNSLQQQGLLQPTQVFFFDATQQQPAVIIYKVAK